MPELTIPIVVIETFDGGRYHSTITCPPRDVEIWEKAAKDAGLLVWVHEVGAAH